MRTQLHLIPVNSGRSYDSNDRPACVAADISVSAWSRRSIGRSPPNLPVMLRSESDLRNWVRNFGSLLFNLRPKNMIIRDPILRKPSDLMANNFGMEQDVISGKSRGMFNGGVQLKYVVQRE